MLPLAIILIVLATLSSTASAQLVCATSAHIPEAIAQSCPDSDMAGSAFTGGFFAGYSDFNPPTMQIICDYGTDGDYCAYYGAAKTSGTVSFTTDGDNGNCPASFTITDVAQPAASPTVNQRRDSLFAGAVYDCPASFNGNAYSRGTFLKGRFATDNGYSYNCLLAGYAYACRYDINGAYVSGSGSAYCPAQLCTADYSGSNVRKRHPRYRENQVKARDLVEAGKKRLDRIEARA